jgi:hypothetical protein
VAGGEKQVEIERDQFERKTGGNYREMKELIKKKKIER